MIKAVGHRILVKRQKLEERDEVFKSATKAGIVIADNSDKVMREAGVDRGVVVDVGLDAFLAFYWNAHPHCEIPFAPWCKAGDTIVFAKYGGKDIKEDEVDYIMINDEDVIGVIE